MSRQHRQGEVVWAPDAYSKKGMRPYLILTNNMIKSFEDPNYICAALTTTSYNENIEVGQLTKWKTLNEYDYERLSDSHINPWSISTIRQSDMRNSVGVITEQVFNEVIEMVFKYIVINTDYKNTEQKPETMKQREQTQIK